MARLDVVRQGDVLNLNTVARMKISSLHYPQLKSSTYSWVSHFPKSLTSWSSLEMSFGKVVAAILMSLEGAGGGPCWIVGSGGERDVGHDELTVRNRRCKSRETSWLDLYSSLGSYRNTLWRCAFGPTTPLLSSETFSREADYPCKMLQLIHGNRE